MAEDTKQYVADFETTVPKTNLYSDNDDIADEHDVAIDTIRHAERSEKEGARVWAAALTEVAEEPKEEDVELDHTIDGFISRVRKLASGSVVWFHNLAFDGTFLISHLLSIGYKISKNGRPATEEELEEIEKLEAKLAHATGEEEQELNHELVMLEQQIERREKAKFRKPKAGEISVVIADTGAYYGFKVTFHNGNRCIEFKDSHKKLPFSLDSVAESFKTKAKKLVGSIDYTKPRPEGYVFDDIERKYIVNDVLVASEAMHKIATSEVDLTEGYTIGGSCMQDLLTMWGGGSVKMGRMIFKDILPPPPLELDEKLRKSYKGGWCINNTDGEIIGQFDGVHRGHTIDVNSLYPDKMRGHRYPYGDPTEHPPEDFPKIDKGPRAYIVRFKAKFTVKDNHVPFVQDKGALFGDQVHIRDSIGVMELTLTRPDFELFEEQYDVDYMEPLELWSWPTVDNLFDDYIDRWYETRMEAKKTGDYVTDMIAKLMLNNLYGKLSQAPVRGSAIPYLDDEGILKYETYETISDGGYIPIGSYITAYARCTTIRAAQKIIDSGRTFLYADTDSIHFLGSMEDLPIEIGKKLGQWDHEASWDVARFVRQKTYIEHIVNVSEPYLDIKAAGAPANVKKRLQYDVTHKNENGDWVFLPLEKDGDTIISPKRPKQEVVERFQVGLVEVGKLRRKSVPGGTSLEETTFQIHSQTAA